MRKLTSLLIGVGILSATSIPALGQFEGFVNQGLVGVGVLSGDLLDALGLDTLGGIGSGGCFDATTWWRTPRAEGGFTYGGVYWAVSDRGYGSSGFDYHPRMHKFLLSITPDYGTGTVGQTQITLTNTETIVFTGPDGTTLTGFDANDSSGTSLPRTLPSSAGHGHIAFDPEGFVRLPNGDVIVCDEYGPLIVRFNAQGQWLSALQPPVAYIPKRGTYPNTTNSFTGASNPTTGRVRNRGFEGLTRSPDGRRLFAILQDPIVQDGGLSKASQNNRILVFDIEPGSPMEGRPIAEYVYRMTLSGSATANNVQTGASELLALNDHELLVMERDGNGYGAEPPTLFSYKRIVLVSLLGATNLINTGYDLELNAPGALGMPTSAVPTNIAPVTRMDFVNLLDATQLAKFGLNLSTNWDQNTLSEKWETLTLVPLNDPAAPNDYLLLTCNDNDFLAHVAYVNGLPVATNTLHADTRMLAFRVTLPTYGAPTSANLPPSGQLLAPTNAVIIAPGAFTLRATVYDQDGVVTNVLFYEGDTLLGQDSTFPFSLAMSGVAAGNHDYKIVVQDNSGANTTSAVLTVTVAADLVAIERGGAAGTLTLRWLSGGVLQWAERAEGPYLDLSNATSPWVVPTSEAMRFYRIRR